MSITICDTHLTRTVRYLSLTFEPVYFSAAFFLSFFYVLFTLNHYPLHHYHYVKITILSIGIKDPFSFFMYLYIEILASINLKT